MRGKPLVFHAKISPNVSSFQAYCYSFDTVPHTWMTVRIPFSALIPVFRAKTVQGVGAIATHHITAFQLMLSKFEYDGALNPNFSPGAFQIQVESIRAYGGDTPPRFILVSSGDPHQEDIVRQSGIPYLILQPGSLTNTPGGAIEGQQTELAVGDLSWDEVAETVVRAIASP